MIPLFQNMYLHFCQKKSLKKVKFWTSTKSKSKIKNILKKICLIKFKIVIDYFAKKKNHPTCIEKNKTTFLVSLFKKFLNLFSLELHYCKFLKEISELFFPFALINSFAWCDYEHVIKNKTTILVSPFKKFCNLFSLELHNFKFLE